MGPATIDSINVSVGNVVLKSFDVVSPSPFYLCRDGFLDDSTGIISSSGSMSYAVTVREEIIDAGAVDALSIPIEGRLIDERSFFFVQGGMASSCSCGDSSLSLESVDGSELAFSFVVTSGPSFLLTFSFSITDMNAYSSWFDTLSVDEHGFRPVFDLELSLMP